MSPQQGKGAGQLNLYQYFTLIRGDKTTISITTLPSLWLSLITGSNCYGQRTLSKQWGWEGASIAASWTHIMTH